MRVFVEIWYTYKIQMTITLSKPLSKQRLPGQIVAYNIYYRLFDST